MHRLFFIAVAAALLILSSLSALAAEEPSLDEILGGFEEEELTSQPEQTGETAAPSPLDLSGSLTIGAAYAYQHEAPDAGETDWRGLQKLRAELALALDYDISRSWRARLSGRGYYDFAYAINGRDEYTDDVLDEYEKEASVQDAYVQATLARNLDIKEGRQVVVWGTSDNIRVTDVINPIDLREPGLVDLEDLRIPLWMTRVDYYTGGPTTARWNLTALAVHENRTDKTPPWGSDFYPGDRPPYEEETARGPEYGAALTGRFTGWDAALYWANIYENSPHAESTLTGQRVLRYSRLTMYGGSASAAAGNWLVKAEAAHFTGLEFLNDPGERYSRTDLMAGVEYSGLSEATISLEAVNRHLNNYDSRLDEPPDSASEDSFQWALRYTQDFLHDTVALNVVALAFGLEAENGSMERYSVEYNYTDALTLRCGVLAYQSGKRGPLASAGHNDRIFLEAKYSL